jgi:hypothetical protein
MHLYFNLGAKIKHDYTVVINFALIVLIYYKSCTDYDKFEDYCLLYYK